VVLRPRLEQQRTVFEGLKRLDRRGAPLREQRTLIAAVVDDARQVSHQLAQGHRPRLLRELGHVRLNLFVEIQLAFVQQQADGGRRERLGSSADVERHVRHNRHAVLEIGPAKAFRPDDVGTDTHRNRQPGKVLLVETGTDDSPPLLYGVGPLLRRRGMHDG
jgi:hypothetical protein